MERKLAEAGFREVQSEKIVVSISFNSPEEFVRFRQDTSAATVKALENETRERRAEAWQWLAEAVRAFADPTGRIVLPNEMIMVSGTG